MYLKIIKSVETYNSYKLVYENYKPTTNKQKQHCVWYTEDVNKTLVKKANLKTNKWYYDVSIGYIRNKVKPSFINWLTSN